MLAFMVTIFTNCFFATDFSGQQLCWWPGISFLFKRTLPRWSRLYQDLFCNYWSWIRDIYIESVFLLLKMKRKLYLGNGGQLVGRSGCYVRKLGGGLQKHPISFYRLDNPCLSGLILRGKPVSGIQDHKRNCARRRKYLRTLEP